MKKNRLQSKIPVIFNPFLAIILILIFYSPVFSTEYYVNNNAGNDSNSGTDISFPWKSLLKIEAQKLLPGDVVNFAKGSEWHTAKWESLFIIKDSGTIEKPIIFRSYGEGDLPVFSNGGQVWNKGIQISGKHIIIEELHVKNTGYCGFVISKGATNNIIRKCEVSNCGMGILCYGSNNLFTQNYIHNLKMIIDNEIPDTISGGADFGSVCFWLYGPYNEISYNKCIDNISHSFDYITDGGFIEFYHNCNGTTAHHNWIKNGNGIAEGSEGTGKNIVISNNMFIENGGFLAFHTNNFEIDNFVFENNTCITTKGTLWNNMYNFYEQHSFGKRFISRNNIFVLGGDKDEKVTRNNNFLHSDNIYHLLDGSTLGDLILGPGEKVADPEFLDPDKYDFRLKPKSPAKGKGTELNNPKDFYNKTGFKIQK